jgi:ribosomal protein S13/uncharacterized protein YnzC (UPF0291/DUF896 family)
MLKKNIIESFTEIKGIGLTKAYALYNNGFDSLIVLRSTSIDNLSKINGIGNNLANEIHNQIDIILRKKRNTFLENNWKSIKYFINNYRRIDLVMISFFLRENLHKLRDLSKFFFNINKKMGSFNHYIKNQNFVNFISVILFFSIISILSWYLYRTPQYGSKDFSLILVTIISALSTILAITFSITLVGAQLATSKFGISINDLFFSEFTFMYMVFFIISIIIPIYILKIQNIFYINLCVVLAFSCLILLPFYFFYIKQNFNPLKILKRYKSKYTKELKILIKIWRRSNSTIISYCDKIDNLIFSSFNERDFNTFKNGLLFFNIMSYYIEILKLNYHKEFLLNKKESNKFIYIKLEKILFQINFHLNKITSLYKTNNLALISYLTCMREYIVILINEIEKLKSNSSNTKEIIEIIIKNILKKSKYDILTVKEYIENNLLRKEFLRLYRHTGINAAKTEQVEILKTLFEDIFFKTCIDISGSVDKDNNDELLNDFIAETMILGSSINEWCIDKKCQKISSEIKDFLKDLEPEYIENVYNSSIKVIDKEFPELLTPIYEFKLQIIG